MAKTWKRVMIKLSGEALMGKGQYGIDISVANRLAADIAAGRVRLPLSDQGGRVAHLHGHCHQKAFERMGAVETVLRAVPGLTVRPKIGRAHV